MSIEALVIEDSISMDGIRLTTFQLKYHRYIHGEVMTHRVFSRNASSSRAIPVAKMRAQVWSDPAMPVHWGANQKGMQASTQLAGIKLAAAKFIWKSAAKAACVFSWAFEKVGLHKQVANRILEPWQWMHVVLTATEFDNFFKLRAHPDAQPEIYVLAHEMLGAMNKSSPVRRDGASTDPRAWHLPYVEEEERSTYLWDYLVKLSTARCARVSYLTHDNKHPDPLMDFNLHNRLVGSEPIHASPTEHQAHPAMWGTKGTGNFRGWVQYRSYVESKFFNK